MKSLFKSEQPKDIFLSYLFRNLKWFSLLIVGNIGVAISYVIWSFFMKGVADAIVSQQFQDLYNLILLGLGFLVIYFIVNHFKEFSRRKLLFSINAQLKKDVFNSALNKSINDFNSENSAKYINILNNDVSVIENDYFMNLPTMIENIITAVIASIALFLFHPYIALFVLCFAFTPMIIPKIYGKVISDARFGLSHGIETYTAKIKDLFGGFELIKSFSIEEQVEGLHKGVVEQVEHQRYNYRRKYAKSQIYQEVLVYLNAIIQQSLSVYLVIKGQISFGVLLGAMQVSNYVTNPLNHVTAQILGIKSTRKTRDKIAVLIKGSVTPQPTAMTQSQELIEDHKQLSMLQSATPVTVHNLSFGYDEADLKIKNVSFTFEQGKKYAIVGPSGCGKSTLIKLLMNYHHTYQGSIYIDEHELKSIDKISFYQHFSTIHQSTFLFDDSIRNNITLYKHYDDEKLYDVIEKAGLHDFISQLPEGIETKINEGGSNLSGGEQQRISIARALLKESKVLLVDEATANLDNALSKKIDDLILSAKDLTAIVVTHKLSSSHLDRYDCIIALKNGKVHEYGKFSELMHRKEYFYGLYTVNQNTV